MADPARRRLWLTVTALILADVLSSMEGGMIYPALPAISREYRDLGDASWLITAFVLVAAGTAAIAARLGDLFGRRRVLLIILGLCAVGSAVSASSDHLGWIIAGRAIQGVSGAILPLCYGIVRDVAPRSESPFWIGVLTASFGASGGASMVIGGVITQYLSWHGIFYVTLGLSIAALLIVLAFVPRLAPAPFAGKLDLLGGVLFVPAIAGILFAATKASQWGWASTPAIGVLTASLVALAAWIVYELRHPNPLIDVRLFARRQISLANMLFVLLGFGHLQLKLIVMLYIQQPAATGAGLGLSASLASLLILPMTLAATVTSIYGGWLTTRHGARLTAIIGAIAETIAWTWLTFCHSDPWQVAVGALVSGLGSGLILTAVPILVLAVAPPERSSEVTGITAVVRSVFTAIGAQVAVAILAVSTIPDPARPGGTFPSEQAYVLAFGFSTVMCVLMIFTALALPRRP